MTEFSKIPWICDGNRPAWLQDDDWIRLDNISLKAKYFNSWIIGDKYYFPTNHPYSICAEYNAKNPAKPQMVPWNTKQGEHVNAPEDWDEGEVLLRDGMKYRDSAYYRWGNESYAYDIVGYVPEANTSSLSEPTKRMEQIVGAPFVRRDSTSALAGEPETRSFQNRVKPWLLACFGEQIAGDREERNHRFLEEALELVQACGCTASEAHQLVDYVFGRDVGEPTQKVGGVMVTLAALCLANDLDMHANGETELARIWTKVEAIRAKHAAKPKHSPLPQAVDPVAGASGSTGDLDAIAHAVNFLRNYGDAIRDMQGERDNLRQIVIEAGIAAEAYHVAANKCVRGDEIVHDRSLTEAANDFHAKTYHLRKFAAALNPKGEAQ